MRRPSIVIMFVIILIYGSATFLVAVGWTDAAEVDINLAGQDTVEESRESVEEDTEDDSLVGGIPLFGAALETLYGMIVSVAGMFKTLAEIVMLGPMVLESAGIPGAIATWVTAGLWLVVAIDLMYILVGRIL